MELLKVTVIQKGFKISENIWAKFQSSKKLVLEKFIKFLKQLLHC